VSSCLPVYAEPDIGIGAGETNTLTHLRFRGIPKGARIIRVSTHLIVDQVAPVGRNFFAVQVNFPNKTWAHGGPLIKSGKEKANWGGLVNRGGGRKDYKEANWEKDLLLIECGIDKPNTVPWSWERNTEYVLTVERGELVHLPAGTNARFNVTVPARSMWRWEFSIRPVNDDSEPYHAFIYNSADYISSFYLWNQVGLGSTHSQQHTRWSLLVYRTEEDKEDQVPSGWKRF
jgi:hypothetical protein